MEKRISLAYRDERTIVFSQLYAVSVVLRISCSYSRYWHDNHFSKKVRMFVRVLPTIYKKEMTALTHGGNKLIHNSARIPDEVVFCLLASEGFLNSANGRKAAHPLEQSRCGNPV